ncbi:MAG: hypothetical protein JWL88_10 [Parcubacteria group bacterium]|nr:hypothetical protein [Parcubacteria group bacterium]
MEKFPGSRPNKIENEAEKIPSRESVLAAMETYVGEGATISKELSDDKGLYLLEMETTGENEGDVTRYEYVRKGKHASGHDYSGIDTKITVVYYENDIAVFADQIAKLDVETGEWKSL